LRRCGPPRTFGAPLIRPRRSKAQTDCRRRMVTDDVADLGNRESQARTDSADRRAVENPQLPCRPAFLMTPAEGSWFCQSAIWDLFAHGTQTGFSAVPARVRAADGPLSLGASAVLNTVTRITCTAGKQSPEGSSSESPVSCQEE
jgi:hypothetical protein